MTKIQQAERSVIRAAMGVVNEDGWAFNREQEMDVVLFPGSMRRLEAAIQRLKEERKIAKRRKK